jgi:hypothetical protein
MVNGAAIMVSPLSPLQLQGQQIDITGALIDGRDAYQRSQLNQQAMQQNEQQIAYADYDQAVQRLSVINRLATKVKQLPQDQRASFVSSINQDMLRSVGIDPAQVSSVQLDDQSLDALIAQTASAIPEDRQSQYRKESVSTNQGLMVFDPSTGSYVPATGSDGQPLSAAQYDPSLQEQISSARQTGRNVSDLELKPEITRSVAEAEASVRAETEPRLQAEITRAREEAAAAVEKQISQQGQLGKLADAESVYNRMRDSDLDIIYGQGEKWYPEFLRSQKGIDLLADRDQLIGMLQLGSRGELKGQGPITDSEQKILSNAVTVLGSPNISPARAREALDEAMTILRRNAGQPAAQTTAPVSGETAAQRLARLRGGN